MPGSEPHPARPSAPPAPPGRRWPALSEAQVWRAFESGWRQLHGSFRELGFSIEWHDFTARETWDWTPSFHADGLEICLNLAGQATVMAERRRLVLADHTCGFYLQRGVRLRGQRAGGEHHQFITVEMSLDFIRRTVAEDTGTLHPLLREVLAGKSTVAVSEPGHLSAEHQRLVASLQRPPVHRNAQRMWYQAKALEVAATFLYAPGGSEELFCQRQQRMNHERALKVAGLLKENLAEPPSLEEIGQRVGCSHFYLSRIFSQAMGCSITQYLRDLRLDHAAELLRLGKHNVTEAAMEVGYNSLSHFSQAFRERFGCCPGLFPTQTPVQKAKPEPNL